MKLFIFGAGFSSRAFVERVKHKAEWIGGTTRSADKFAALEALGIEPFLFDGETANAEIVDALKTATHLLVSIAPPRKEDGEDPTLSAFADALRAAGKLQWIGYLSTVGVYGNHDGAWVDEETECKPVSARSIARVAAEDAWLAFGKQNNISTGVFRLSGIYGPGRNTFMNIEKGTSRRLVKPGQVFNRIHVNDIATALDAASDKGAGGIFNITDDEPAPPQDVVSFAHDLMEKVPPPEIDFATADLSPMARSFYGENKRVANAKSKTVLGMQYAYPNYREALHKMWTENSWKT